VTESLYDFQTAGQLVHVQNRSYLDGPLHVVERLESSEKVIAGIYERSKQLLLKQHPFEVERYIEH
jgi:hypothetical protein